MKTVGDTFLDKLGYFDFRRSIPFYTCTQCSASYIDNPHNFKLSAQNNDRRHSLLCVASVDNSHNYIGNSLTLTLIFGIMTFKHIRIRQVNEQVLFKI